VESSPDLPCAKVMNLLPKTNAEFSCTHVCTQKGKIHLVGRFFIGDFPLIGEQVQNIE
jgi:hypothetical protein